MWQSEGAPVFIPGVIDEGHLGADFIVYLLSVERQRSKASQQVSRTILPRWASGRRGVVGDGGVYPQQKHHQLR